MNIFSISEIPQKDIIDFAIFIGHAENVNNFFELLKNSPWTFIENEDIVYKQQMCDMTKVSYIHPFETAIFDGLI